LTLAGGRFDNGLAMPDGEPTARRASGRGKARRSGPGKGPRGGGSARPAPALPHGDPRAILETASLGVLMVDRDGRIAWLNGQGARLFGYAWDELVGQPLETLLPERLRAAHAGHRRGFFADPRARPMGLGLDLAARRSDGTEFPVEISLSYVEGEAGILALAFVTDITARKSAERSLQAEFAVTRVFAEAGLTEPLVPRLLQVLCESLGAQRGEFWRVDGEVLRWDAGWQPPGLDAAELDRASRETTFAPGVGLPGRVWATGHAVCTKDVLRSAAFLRTAPAARLGLRAACAFPIESNQRVSGVMVLLSREVEAFDEALLAMLTDIGRRIGSYLDLRRAEQEVGRQREMLHRSEKLAALGRLLGGIAHEINNPLGIISSRLELMLEEAAGQALPAEHLEDLRVLHRNVQRVAGIAQGLRSFARQPGGKPGPLSLNAVVEETLRLVGRSMRTDNIAVVTALDATLPAMLGDANALQQVLLNLITNAREAMAGGGQLRIETGRLPGRPGWLRLVIADTGPGVAPGDLPRLFEPFYTTKAAGTGLGLAVSATIVHDHQGTIDVASAPGEGATFTLAFPALDRAIDHP
jgi:hypothetical protein